MRSKPGRHMVDVLFTLALFCVFAASALLVVLIGANVYRSTVSQMDENFSTRTSVTYVTTKIRQNDTDGGVSVITFDGTPVILLTQEVEGSAYQTWIYHYDGALRELFFEKGAAFELADGQVIVEVPSFEIGRDGAAVTLTATDAQGNTIHQQVAPRCGLFGALPGGGEAKA